MASQNEREHNERTRKRTNRWKINQVLSQSTGRHSFPHQAGCGSFGQRGHQWPTLQSLPGEMHMPPSVPLAGQPGWTQTEYFLLGHHGPR